jgi:hypothetical protein
MQSTTIVCPYCRARSHMTIHGDSHTYSLGGVTSDLYRWSAAFTCDGCHEMVIAACTTTLNPYGTRLSGQEFWELTNGIEWLPLSAVGRVFEYVPEHIASAASEAYSCQSINAHRAAAALARSVIEATAKEKGFTDGNLFKKIDDLQRANLIRPLIAEAAHEVRHLGNDIAHGDFVEPISGEESDEILVLMSEVLEEVFTTPARIEAVRQGRINRKGS